MEFTMEVLYRQTLNLISREWVFPERKTGPDTWVVARNIESVISPKFGYAGAIRRMQRVFNKMRNPDGTKVWKTETETVRLPKDSKRRSEYAVTYLKCRRTNYGFSRSL